MAQKNEQTEGQKEPLTATKEVAEKQKADIRSQERVLGVLREEMAHLKGQIEIERRVHHQAEEQWRERERGREAERERDREREREGERRRARERVEEREWFRRTLAEVAREMGRRRGTRQTSYILIGEASGQGR